MTCAKYVKAKGMVPVVRLTMSGNSFYSDFEGDDIWSKFFNQPEGYTLEEVIHSANVYFLQDSIMEVYRVLLWKISVRMQFCHGLAENIMMQ